MTVNETFVLMLALQADDRLQIGAVASAMHGTADNAWPVLNSLRRQGAIEHVRYDHWRITEKGRIAAALAMHQDPKLASAFEPERPASLFTTAPAAPSQVDAAIHAADSLTHPSRDSSP